MLHESEPPTKYCVFHTKTELGSTCGIRAVCPRSGETICEINDVCPKYVALSQLASRMESAGVDPAHLMSIIEDFIDIHYGSKPRS